MNNLKTIVKLSHLFHRGARQIRIDFEYDFDTNLAVKKMDASRWSQTHKCWYVFNNRQNLKEIFAVLKGIAKVDSTELFQKEEKAVRQELPFQPDFEKAVEQYVEELVAKSYSKSTIKAHRKTITNFLDFYKAMELTA